MVSKYEANEEDASPIATKKQKAIKTKAVDSPAPKKSKKKAVEEVAQEEEEEKEEETEEVIAPKKTASKKEKPAKKASKAKKEVAPALEEPTQAEEAATAEVEDADEEVDAATEELVETLDVGAEDDMQDEQVSTFKKGQDVGKVPKPKKASKSANGKTSVNSGVVYLGSVPHGFYEHEIKEYFSQFGEITRLRVVRSKKTGASKHRAFIEFADTEVADIAARTMDSYLLFGHILRAKLVEPSQVHPELFKGSNRRFKAVPWNQMVGRHLERPLDESKWQGKIAKEEKRRTSRAEKLKAIGYEFEAPALKVAKAQEVAEVEGATEEAVKAVEAPAVVEEEQKVEEAEKPEEPTSISQPKAKKAKKGTKAKKVKA